MTEQKIKKKTKTDFKDSEVFHVELGLMIIDSRSQHIGVVYEDFEKIRVKDLLAEAFRKGYELENIIFKKIEAVTEVIQEIEEG